MSEQPKMTPERRAGLVRLLGERVKLAGACFDGAACRELAAELARAGEQDARVVELERRLDALSSASLRRRPPSPSPPR